MPDKVISEQLRQQAIEFIRPHVERGDSLDSLRRSCMGRYGHGAPVVCPRWLPDKGWSIHQKGYVIYTSRRRHNVLVRGDLIHRVIVAALGASLTPVIHIHHQDFDKRMNCPRNLLICPISFNPAPQTRHCDSGRYMSAPSYHRLLTEA